MEIIFQRPGMCQRPEIAPGTSGGKVETCQRREGRDVPAAGRSRRASAGHQRPGTSGGGRDVPAAGRSRRASGRKVETCQRPGRSRRASGGHQRPGRASGREGRDVPAAGTSGRKVETCQRRAPAAGRSRRASGRRSDVPAAGRSRRASGRAPAAGTSVPGRRASGGKVETCQRPEGRDVPAAGRSRRASAGKVETCQRRHQRADVRRIIITLVTTQLVVLFLLPKICHKARKYGTFLRVPFYSLYPLQSARPQQRRIYRHRHHRPRIGYIRFSRVISPIPHGLHLRGARYKRL